MFLRCSLLYWHYTKLNKPVIVATQMLGSMVNSEFPTRAEITDVANAAYLRADSTMTSEETTIGINPVNTIETMANILMHADSDAIANPYDWSRVENIPENDWSRSVASMAYLNKASADAEELQTIFAGETWSAIKALANAQ